MIVLDSLRYDSWLAADPGPMGRIGRLERRWSYASWTAPSHYNKLMGLLPHASPTRVYASEYYKHDYSRYSERLGVEGIEFKRLLPSIFLPTFLRSLGYTNHACVSMPVLNPATPLNHGFDDYRLMPKHNDFAAMLETIEFSTEQPSYWLLNVGETHYPYALPDEDPSQWPRISGLHGVLRRIGQQDDEEAFFDENQLAELRQRQIDALSYVDGVIGAVYDRVPAGTWVVVTSDHGELFGEDGYFGHGPIQHDKVYEVPFVEGRIR
jgi:hypothetical protein